MNAYCPHCRAYVSAYYRSAAERRLAQHITAEHPNEEGGAVGRPHHTTQQDERRQQ